jgi:hypothetical protein
MWVYEQDSGDLFHNGKFVGTGYSGAGKTRSQGRNNSHLEHVKGVGPLPRGEWKIGKPRYSESCGPFVLPLAQVPAKPLRHGRSAFLIHGDNKASNASRGCIILAKSLREQIAYSSDTKLLVVRDTDDHKPEELRDAE